jgi:alkanesulfonate monooxygenase SsuD/methylene tetrahydromethanopterin reductase-like flavin-dependent oxidoreductase (luciferase family)
MLGVYAHCPEFLKGFLAFYRPLKYDGRLSFAREPSERAPGLWAALMRLGLALSVQHRPEDPQAARFADHVEQVRVARAVGFTSVWAGQHYLAEPFTYFQPIPTLARVAAEADGMLLGTGVLLLPLFQPVEVAEQLATLDVISGGRLVFGVGLGYRDAENRALGVDPRERVSRLEESLAVIERLWSGEPVTHRGRHFTLDEVRISMPPVQRPRPPIWFAANTDGGVRRAARLGDAWLLNPHTALETLERQVALFHETRRALGRPPATETPLIKECAVAPTTREAVDAARPFLEAKYAAYRRWEQDKALPAGETWSDRFEDLARDRFLLGDPARVAEEVQRCRERLGVTTLIVRVQWPGMAQATVLRSIRLLGEQVLPRL